MNTYTLKVFEIRRETKETITLCFKQPGLKKIKYLAGQYLTLIFRINGRRYIRPYSFSSAPSVDLMLEITVKRIPNGIVSNHIHDIIKEGDIIEVMPPMGNFICPSIEGNYEIFLWGIGSGITPLISIIKELLSTTNVEVSLIYGNRDQQSTIFFNLIKDLSVKYQNRFKIWYLFTNLSVEDNLQFIFNGRITEQTVVEIIKGVEIENTIHYICGPTSLKKSIKYTLIKNEVKSSRIFVEDFELVKDPTDFEEIQTRNINLQFLNQYYSLEVIKGKSILESALDAGIELPYSCQTGNCSTCKAKIVSGETKMIGLDRKREDLLDNECLICCAHPLTENVCIEI